LLFLSLLSFSSCSKGDSPIVPSVSFTGNSHEKTRITHYQPQNNIYFERTGPEELLNPNLEIPWTVDNKPVFTAIFHSNEEITFQKIWGGIDGLSEMEVINEGYQFKLIPKYELKPGYHHVNLGVIFNEKVKPYGIIARWRFEVRDEPPQIIGTLEDEKTNKVLSLF